MKLQSKLLIGIIIGVIAFYFALMLIEIRPSNPNYIEVNGVPFVFYYNVSAIRAYDLQDDGFKSVIENARFVVILMDKEEAESSGMFPAFWEMHKTLEYLGKDHTLASTRPTKEHPEIPAMTFNHASEKAPIIYFKLMNQTGVSTDGSQILVGARNYEELTLVVDKMCLILIGADKKADSGIGKIVKIITGKEG